MVKQTDWPIPIFKESWVGGGGGWLEEFGWEEEEVALFVTKIIDI
jgi:hypothetical protein